MKSKYNCYLIFFFAFSLFSCSSNHREKSKYRSISLNFDEGEYEWGLFDTSLQNLKISEKYSNSIPSLKMECRDSIMSINLLAISEARVDTIESIKFLTTHAIIDIDGEINITALDEAESHTIELTIGTYKDGYYCLYSNDDKVYPIDIFFTTKNNINQYEKFYDKFIRVFKRYKWKIFNDNSKEWKNALNETDKIFTEDGDTIRIVKYKDYDYLIGKNNRTLIHGSHIHCFEDYLSVHDLDENAIFSKKGDLIVPYTENTILYEKIYDNSGRYYFAEYDDEMVIKNAFDKNGDLIYVSKDNSPEIKNLDYKDNEIEEANFYEGFDLETFDGFKLNTLSYLNSDGRLTKYPDPKRFYIARHIYNKWNDLRRSGSLWVYDNYIVLNRYRYNSFYSNYIEERAGVGNYTSRSLEDDYYSLDENTNTLTFRDLNDNSVIDIFKLSEFREFDRKKNR